VARAYGVDPRDFLQVRSLDEQQSYFQSVLSPLFDKRFVRWICARPVSLYGLGIPRAQYAALAGGANMADVLRERVQRLACDFGLDQNYFAWQAFGRSYAAGGEGPLPPYLRQANFDTIRDRADRVEVLNTNYTGYLAGRPAQSVDRYVLLDAQDWMSDSDLNSLWSEITRTARAGARVIFRTAGEPSILPGRVTDSILSHWRYEAEASRDYTMRDRSAIYGGFHLYVLEG
jgi:S-adenosylmethionine-diacylglycerol 3-amino-3-carboxypropyl transferase